MAETRRSCDIQPERCFAIARLAVALSPGRLDKLRELLPQIVPEPLLVEVAYEILLQSHLFFGFAQALEAVRVFAEVLPPGDAQVGYTAKDSADGAMLRQRGEELCRRVYAPNFERLVGDLRKASPELAEWMVVDGYGKVLSRPGPTMIEREIASIAFLAISGHPVQLHSHLRSARNLGATAEVIWEILHDSGLSNEQLELVRSKIEQVFRP